MIISVVDIIAIVPEIIVVVGACVLLLVDVVIPGGSRKDIIAYLSIAFIALAGWYTYEKLTGAEIMAFGGMFALDGYAMFFKFVFYVGTVFSIIMSLSYVKKESINLGEYYVLMLFSLAGMMIISSGADLLTIYLGIELMSIPIYVLVGFMHRNLRSNEAAMKYVVLGAFSSGLLLFGISLVYGLTGTTELAGIALALKDPALKVPALILAVTMLLAGFGFKVAAAPFHMWAPDVYEGAPTPITAFMSVGVKAAAFAAVLRVFMTAMAPTYDQWYAVVVVLSVASLVVGNVVAIAQTNIKRMLAYSSIGHAGYALLGLVAGTDGGTAAVLYYMLVYTFMNLGAFAVVLMMNRGEKTGDNIEDYTGLAKKNKLLALVMLVFMFSLAGIPPTAGFFGKFFIFMALIDRGMVALAVVALVMSAVAAYYYIRIVLLMYMKEPEGEFELVSSRGLVYVLVLAGVAVLVMGVLPSWFIGLALDASFIL
jgi:NADH-quinone oxidoreductase subunit N